MYKKQNCLETKTKQKQQIHEKLKLKSKKLTNKPKLN